MKIDYYDKNINKEVAVCLGFDGVYGVFCSDNPNCYYKQLQKEKQRNDILLNEIEIQNDIEDKYWQILKDIEEIAKTKIYTPVCFEDLNCPKNGGVGFDNHCDEYCPILTIEKILKKTKEVENE